MRRFSNIRMPLVFSVICTACYVTAQAGASVSFSFPPQNNSIPSDITLFYDAYFRTSLTGLDTIKLTTSEDDTGWAVYDSSIPIWSNNSGAVVSFTTHFQFIIKPDDDDLPSGGGLAFFMAPLGFKAPELSVGKYLGLVNKKTMGDPENHLVAIEFDTDNNYFDHDNNHVGIDINSVVSEVNATVMDGRLEDGKIWYAWVDYDGKGKKLQLFLSHNITKLSDPNLLYHLDLAMFLPENAMVGFSASTSSGTNRHTLVSWNFSCTASWNAPSLHIQGLENGPSNFILIEVLLPGLAVVCGLALLGAWWWWHIKGKRQSTIENESETALDEQLCQGPRKFTFSELSAATKGFNEQEKLGQGGFGAVYRGVLQDSQQVVAVKHISQASTQGKKEYVAEASIINRLGHRNLVQLLGWCHEKGKFLLVYEFMSNKSLDKHIFGESPILDCNLRYNIVCDLASAIVYLHDDWDQCILHRDIKCSNVMLDANFKAKLGDFGLARLVKRDIEATSHTTMVAGTFGYLAPECVMTGKSSRESDVFSFGVVALEIACGRRALDVTLQENHNMRLIDWVWHLYAQDRVLEAADESLRGEFNDKEMERLMVVGLWCSTPDSKARPSMRQVIKVLRLEAPLPCIPLNMPVAVYVSVDPLQCSDELSSATLYRSC